MELRINNNGRGQYAEGWLIDYVNGMFKQLDGETRCMEPPVDVIEDSDFYHFSFEMPGLKNEWLDVRVENGQLRVVGERKLPKLSKETKVRVAERGYGTIRRAFELPQDANHEKIVAGYKDGVLEVTVEKKLERKSAAIVIN